MTIVLTTHNMEEAERLCQRIAIMDYGKIIAEDTPQNLILQHAPDKAERSHSWKYGRCFYCFNWPWIKGLTCLINLKLI